MHVLNIEKKYRQPIIDLWEKYKDLKTLNVPGCEYRKSPLASETIKKNVLLFVGINPSFKKGDEIPDRHKEIGTYIIPLNSKRVPIFFSGMLSVQRALDLGSLERLMWG